MGNNLVKFMFNKENEIVEENTLLTDILTKKKYKSVVIWANDVKLSTNEKRSYIIKENDVIKAIRILSGG